MSPVFPGFSHSDLSTRIDTSKPYHLPKCHSFFAILKRTLICFCCIKENCKTYHVSITFLTPTSHVQLGDMFSNMLRKQDFSTLELLRMHFPAILTKRILISLTDTRCSLLPRYSRDMRYFAKTMQRYSILKREHSLRCPDRRCFPL